ncbi:MAG: hypothetical protein KDI78_08140, partial [Xanthomonadales bacterium]|nr:hypothetical protein [Xanthomonadales bacterium]
RAVLLNMRNPRKSGCCRDQADILGRMPPPTPEQAENKPKLLFVMRYAIRMRFPMRERTQIADERQLDSGRSRTAQG